MILGCDIPDTTEMTRSPREVRLEDLLRMRLLKEVDVVGMWHCAWGQSCWVVCEKKMVIGSWQLASLPEAEQPT